MVGSRTHQQLLSFLATALGRPVDNTKVLLDKVIEHENLIQGNTQLNMEGLVKQVDDLKVVAHELEQYKFLLRGIAIGLVLTGATSVGNFVLSVLALGRH